MKKLISLLLVALLIGGVLAPVAQAQTEVIDRQAKFDLRTAFDEAFALIDSIMEKFACGHENALYQKIRDLIFEIREKFEKIIFGQERVAMYSNELVEPAVGFNPETIYDLDSIPARVQLLGKIGLAMRFATTELRSKVDAAHAKIAGYIFETLVKIANPFNTVSDLENQGRKLELVKSECLAMPDQSPEDTANLYKRAQLDELLTKARFLRFNELKNKDQEVVRELDKVILRITGLRLKPQTTVAEIDAAMVELQEAMDKAIAANGEKAERKDIRYLRKLVWKARGVIIKGGVNGEDIEELKEAHNEASKLVLQIRPNKDAVMEAIAKLQKLLDIR